MLSRRKEDFLLKIAKGKALLELHVSVHDNI